MPIEIINLKSQQKVISTDKSFEISVHVNDILLLESAITEARRFIITSEIFENQFVEIHLNK